MMRVGAGQRGAMGSHSQSGADTVEIGPRSSWAPERRPRRDLQNGDKNVFFESGESAGVAET